MMKQLYSFFTTKEKLFILAAILYGILSIPVLIITKAFIHLFFVWNMILAVVPLLLSTLFRCGFIKKNWMKWMLVLIWILFLPNAFYIITDFIHLTQHTFYIYEHPYAPMIYVREIDAYVAMAHIFVGALIGLLLGIKSITNTLEFLKVKFPKWTFYMILDISLLSSFGIYIGRFLRFNSWDIFNPVTLITSIIVSFDSFALYFIILFVILHVMLIYLMMPLMQDVKKD